MDWPKVTWSSNSSRKAHHVVNYSDLFCYPPFTLIRCSLWCVFTFTILSYFLFLPWLFPRKNQKRESDVLMRWRVTWLFHSSIFQVIPTATADATDWRIQENKRHEFMSGVFYEWHQNHHSEPSSSWWHKKNKYQYPFHLLFLSPLSPDGSKRRNGMRYSLKLHLSLESSPPFLKWSEAYNMNRWKQ